MDSNAIRALRPHLVLELGPSHSEDQILQFIGGNQKRVFLLPRAPFLEMTQLEKFVRAGAFLLCRKEDIQQRHYPRAFLDEAVETFRNAVFVKSYSHFSSKLLLGKGASLLIDGAPPLGGLRPEDVHNLCLSVQAGAKIRVSYYDYQKADLLRLLQLGIRLVFNCYNGAPCNQSLINDCIQAGKHKTILLASDFSQHEMAQFLQKGATVVITGKDQVPINVIQALALDQDSQPKPGQRGLKVIPDGPLAGHIVELEQLAAEQKIELLRNDDIFFNVNSTVELIV